MTKYRARYERTADARGWTVAVVGALDCRAQGRTLASARFGMHKAVGLALRLDGFADLVKQRGAHQTAIPAALRSAGVELEEEIVLPPALALAVRTANDAGRAAREADLRASELKKGVARQLTEEHIEPRDIAALLEVFPSNVEEWTHA